MIKNFLVVYNVAFPTKNNLDRVTREFVEMDVAADNLPSEKQLRAAEKHQEIHGTWAAYDVSCRVTNFQLVAKEVS